MTPRKLHTMKIRTNPNCTLCPSGLIGTFYHMTWECAGVKHLWKMVTNNLSVIQKISVPLSPSLLLLNNPQHLNFNRLNKRVFLAGLTDAKKMIATRWKHQTLLTRRQWLLSFIDIGYLELSTACSHGAKEESIRLWTNTIKTLESFLETSL